MPSLTDLLRERESEDAQEWTPSLLEAPEKQLLPQVVKLAQEIGTDEVLAEAALAWIREKKQQITIAKLVALRGQAYVDALIEKLNEETK